MITEDRMAVLNGYASKSGGKPVATGETLAKAGVRLTAEEARALAIQTFSLET